MPALDAANRAIARLKPVARTWKLYVYQPSFIWTGTVGGTPEQGDEDLFVVTVWGNPLNLVADCTLWVTDSTGRKKIMPSKTRIKNYDAPTTTLTVAKNAIDWQVGDLVSGMLLFELWPRVVWINPATEEQFKDGDIDWVDDATAQPPKANGGPAAIGTLVGGVCDITFRDEGSFTCPTGGAPTSYLWSALGGAPAVQAGALASTWVTLRYVTAGYYYIKYTVTDANGKTGVRYIPVIIDDGTKARVNVDVGDRYWDRIGWAMSRRWIGVNQYGSAFFDGAPVFLVSDAYGTVPQAFADNRAKLRWSGWLSEDTLSKTVDERVVTYRAVSSAHILQNIPAFPTALRDDSDPDYEPSWYYFNDTSIDSICYLLFNWHSTAMQVCDYHPTGEWLARARLGEDAEADSLLSQIDNILVAVFANMRCDRQGILRAMRHEWHLSAAERAARAIVITLDPQDYQQAVQGPRRHQSIVRSVRLSGVDATDEPFMAGAPGNFVLDGGLPREVNYLSPLNQAELNQWAGQHLAFENWKSNVRLVMAGEWDVVDPALGEYVQANLYQFDDKLPRGSVPYSITGVRFRDNHATSVTMGEWELLPNPEEYPGETIQIPEEPPTPPPDDIPDDFPPPVDSSWPSRMYCGTFDKGVYYSEDFSGPDGAMPTWTEHNDIDSDANTLADYGVWCFETEPADRERYQYCIDNTDGEGGSFYNRDRDVSDDWFMRIDQVAADIILTAQGQAGHDGTGFFAWVDVDQLNSGYVYLLYSNRTDVLAKPYLFRSTDYGVTWNYVSLIDQGDANDSHRYTCSIHAYGSDIMFVGNRSGTFRGVRTTYSSDSGATWLRCDTVVGGSTSSYRSVGNFNNLQPLRVYCRGRDAGIGDPHELWYSSPIIAGADSWQLCADPDTGNELPRAGVYSRGDIIWFHPGTVANHRLIRVGNEVTARTSKYYVTTDSWASCDSAKNLSYWNVNSMCDSVNPSAAEMIIYGCEQCDYISPTPPASVAASRHHILVADAIDPITTYAKGGDDVSSAPYVDAIPEDAGGVCHKGIKAVF